MVGVTPSRFNARILTLAVVASLAASALPTLAQDDEESEPQQTITATIALDSLTLATIEATLAYASTLTEDTRAGADLDDNNQVDAAEELSFLEFVNGRDDALPDWGWTMTMDGEMFHFPNLSAYNETNIAGPISSDDVVTASVASEVMLDGAAGTGATHTLVIAPDAGAGDDLRDFDALTINAPPTHAFQAPAGAGDDFDECSITVESPSFDDSWTLTLVASENCTEESTEQEGEELEEQVPGTPTVPASPTSPTKPASPTSPTQSATKKEETKSDDDTPGPGVLVSVALLALAAVVLARRRKA